MKFKVGDIIYNSKDRIVFLVTKVERTKLTLQYMSKKRQGEMEECSFVMTKRRVIEQFQQAPNDLKYYKVLE